MRYHYLKYNVNPSYANHIYRAIYKVNNIGEAYEYWRASFDFPNYQSIKLSQLFSRKKK